MQVNNFLGYQLYYGNIKALTHKVTKLITSKKSDQAAYLSCLNPHSIAIAAKDSQFRLALRKANILVPDGIGCVIGAKLFGFPPFKRISGYEVFEEISRSLNSTNNQTIKIFFLGSTDETLQKIKLRYLNDYPNLKVVGAYSPPFCDNFTLSQDSEMIKMINDSRADLLWVGLSSPKQDLWMDRNSEHLSVSFCAGIGAVFDFYAGNIKRSPKALQVVGLEWFHRLISEPKRLWRRTFISVPIFIYMLIRGLIKKTDA